MPLDGSDYGPVKQLREAMDVIDRAYGLVSKGWVRRWHRRRGDEDAYCALGALTQAIKQNERPTNRIIEMQEPECREHPAVREFCVALGVQTAGDIVNWNDRIAVSRQAVLNVFARAKASLQSQLEKLGV